MVRSHAFYVLLRGCEADESCRNASNGYSHAEPRQ